MATTPLVAGGDVGVGVGGGCGRASHAHARGESSNDNKRRDIAAGVTGESGEEGPSDGGSQVHDILRRLQTLEELDRGNALNRHSVSCFLNEFSCESTGGGAAV